MSESAAEGLGEGAQLSDGKFTNFSLDLIYVFCKKNANFVPA